MAFRPASGIAVALYLHTCRLETGRQIIMLWNNLHSSRGSLRLSTPGATAWLHEPDGTVRRVSGFDGRVIPDVEVRAAAIPLLYEIRPSGR